MSRPSPPPQAFHNLASALGQLSRAEEAKSVLQQGLQAHPQNAALLISLGSICYQLGQYQQAADAYRQALAVEPADFRGMNNLAFVLSEHLQNPAEAEKVASEAVKSGVEDPSLWDTWGVILYRLGKYEDSRAALEKAMSHPQIRPETKQSAMLHLGRTLMKLNPAAGRERLSQLLATPVPKRLISAASFAEAESLLGTRPGTQASPGVSLPSGAASTPAR